MRLEAHRLSQNGFIRALFALALAASAFTALPASASTITRHSSFTYDPTTGLLTSETVEPAATDSTYLKTTYTYDAFGNKTSTTTSTYAGAYGAARTATATYDAKGQFKTKDCNALNQCETWASDARFAEPTSHTGPNGLTTTFSYDGFGRIYWQSNPDGTAIEFDQWYCSGVNGSTATCFGVSGAYLQNTVPIGTDKVAGPSQHVIYDSLSRAIAHSQQGFNGDGDYAYTQYDANGRVGQTSRPVDTGLGNTPKWTVFAYDDLGRVVKATEPNGAVTTTAYHGLSTSVTNSLGQITTAVNNAQGLKASVTDAAGKTTSYGYDAEGDPIWIADSAGDVTTNSFDVRGRKVASTDPDMGHWTYAYDALGELVSQTDAKLQTTTLAYDVLGRVVSRSDASGTANWAYDTAVNGIGKLTSVSTSDGAGRSFTYDTLGRPVTTTITTDGTSYTYTITYNTNNGKVSTIKYPSGLSIKYNYDAHFDSYLASITDAVTGQAYFTVNARDAELHLTGATLGNGASETQSFDPNTGLVQQILAGAANGVANFHYVFDTLGNLKQRQDTVEGTTENFCYDALNRLVNYALGGTACTNGTAGLVKAVSYDAIGNIVTKSDVGTYTYGAGAGPHAVTAVAGTVNGVLNPAYVYDADGNMTGGAGRSVTWTAFNMVAQIAQGTTTVAFAYDGDHNRIKMVIGGASPSTTRYLNDPVTGAMVEKFVTSGGTVTTWRSYIVADGRIVAEKFYGAVDAMRYFVLDHLGSVAVITDETGAVTERLSYDAWGARRCANGTEGAGCFAGSATTRGFTNQEEIDQVGLVNLNARIYDPVLGRFMSADDVVQDVFSPQTLNRYSYTGNNPLSFTDPTGHFFGIDDLIVFAIIVAIVPVIHNIPILSSIATILAGLACGPGCAGAVAAENTGFNGGHIGDIFKSFALTFAEAEAFQQIGGTSWPTPAKAIAAGLVGGTTSVAGGGKFLPGFLSAGVGSLGGPLTEGLGTAGGTVVSAVLGGAASVLGGGKFANGAVTGAFAYAAGRLSEQDQQAAANASGRNAEGANGANGGCAQGCQVAGGEVGEDGRDILDPVQEFDQMKADADARNERENGLKYDQPRDPNKDYLGPALTPQQQRDFDALIQNMESIGGGRPNFVLTPKGATQFIFPNGAKLRFDIAPGQFSPSQGPHINLQDVPGSSDPNIHIPVKPNG